MILLNLVPLLEQVTENHEDGLLVLLINPLVLLAQLLHRHRELADLLHKASKQFIRLLRVRLRRLDATLL